jgi:hypothetical protein
MQGAGDSFHQQKDAGGNLPKRSARALLDIEDPDYVPIIRNPQSDNVGDRSGVSISRGAARSVCSVRLAWQPRPCCGTRECKPCCRRATCVVGTLSVDRASTIRRKKIITDNRVLFHRVANTLNYLDIKTVVVSCGTCYDQLQGYKFEDIFPGSRIVDIHEYLLEKGITLARWTRRVSCTTTPATAP